MEGSSDRVQVEPKYYGVCLLEFCYLPAPTGVLFLSSPVDLNSEEGGKGILIGLWFFCMFFYNRIQVLQKRFFGLNFLCTKFIFFILAFFILL